METIGGKIRHLRNSMGMTQTDLADKLGVTMNAISKWEVGRVQTIPMAKIRMMAEIFDVPVSFLLLDSNADVEMTTGEKLYAFREARRLSLEDLAQQTGISEKRLRNIADDIVKPSVDELYELCRCLKLTDISSLMPDSDAEIFAAGQAHAQSLPDMKDIGDASTLLKELRMGNYTFSAAERRLVKEFSRLNSKGQSVAIERISELSEVRRYQDVREKYRT